MTTQGVALTEENAPRIAADAATAVAQLITGEKVNATASCVSLLLGGAKGIFRMKKRVRGDTEDAPSPKHLNNLMARGFISILHLLKEVTNQNKEYVVKRWGAFAQVLGSLPASVNVSSVRAMTNTDSVAFVRVSKHVDGSDAVHLPLNGQALLKATLNSQFPEATGMRYLERSASWASPAGSWMAVPVGGHNSHELHPPPTVGWDPDAIYVTVSANVFPQAVGEYRSPIINRSTQSVS